MLSRRGLSTLTAATSILIVSGALTPVALAAPTSLWVSRAGLGRADVARAAVVPRPRYTALVIGHRGAPAYQPEHTLAGYQLAIDQGADYIETDLVSTMDGHLVARHESDLTITTDVLRHPELGGRTRTEQLTLAEIRTLRAGSHAIPTLDEIITLIRTQKRPVGLYLELKSADRSRQLGLPMEEKIAAVLAAQGWNGADAPVYLESFEAPSLVRMRQLVPDAKLTRIVDSSAILDDAALDGIAEYASVLAVRHDLLQPGADPDLLARAKLRGLDVHVWTLAREPLYPGPAHPSDPPGWAGAVRMDRAFYAIGVDAVFTDAPDIAVWARGLR